MAFATEGTGGILVRTWNSRSGKIGAICAGLLLIALVVTIIVYVSSGGKEPGTPGATIHTPLTNVPLAIPPLTSQNHTSDQNITQKYTDLSTRTFNTSDDLISAFKDIDISKVDETKLNDDSKEKKALQALRKMSTNTIDTLSRLKDISEGKRCSMTQQDREALKEFVDSSPLSDDLRQAITRNLNDDNKIIIPTRTTETPIQQNPITDENVEEMKKEFGDKFLKAINSINFKIDFTDEGQLKKIATFATIPENDIKKLYVLGTGEKIDNAIKFRKVASDVNKVWNVCKGKDPKSQPHDADTLGRICLIEPYLEVADCLRFKDIFNPPIGPVDVEKLKKFDHIQAKFNVEDFANLKTACNDSIARSNNPKFNALCDLLPELETFFNLVEANTPADNVEHLEHLFKLKRNVNMIVDDKLNDLLDRSRDAIISNYLAIAKVEDLPNPPPIDIAELLVAGQFLFSLKSNMYLQSPDPRITELRNNNQLDTAEKLIVKDLSYLMQELHIKSKDSTMLVPEKDKLSARITVLFNAIRKIDPTIPSDEATYLNMLDAIWKFDEAKRLVIEELKTKIITITPRWIHATGVNAFEDTIKRLMTAYNDARAVVSTTICNEIKATWLDTFQALAKLAVAPALRKKIDVDVRGICLPGSGSPPHADCQEWINLIVDFKKIPNVLDDLPHAFGAISDYASMEHYLKLYPDYEGLLSRKFNEVQLNLETDFATDADFKKFTDFLNITGVENEFVIGDVQTAFRSILAKKTHLKNVYDNRRSITATLAVKKDALALKGISTINQDLIDRLLGFTTIGDSGPPLKSLMNNLNKSSNLDPDDIIAVKDAAQTLLFFDDTSTVNDLATLNQIENELLHVIRNELKDIRRKESWVVRTYLEQKMIQATNTIDPANVDARIQCAIYYQHLQVFSPGLPNFDDAVYSTLNSSAYSPAIRTRLNQVKSVLIPNDPKSLDPNILDDYIIGPNDPNKGMKVLRDAMFYEIIDPSSDDALKFKKADTSIVYKKRIVRYFYKEVIDKLLEYAKSNELNDDLLKDVLAWFDSINSLDNDESKNAIIKNDCLKKLHNLGALKNVLALNVNLELDDCLYVHVEKVVNFATGKLISEANKNQLFDDLNACIGKRIEMEKHTKIVEDIWKKIAKSDDEKDFLIKEIVEGEAEKYFNEFVPEKIRSLIATTDGSKIGDDDLQYIKVSMMNLKNLKNFVKNPDFLSTPYESVYGSVFKLLANNIPVDHFDPTECNLLLGQLNNFMLLPQVYNQKIYMRLNKIIELLKKLPPKHSLISIRCKSEHLWRVNVSSRSVALCNSASTPQPCREALDNYWDILDSLSLTVLWPTLTDNLNMTWEKAPSNISRFMNVELNSYIKDFKLGNRTGAYKLTANRSSIELGKLGNKYPFYHSMFMERLFNPLCTYLNDQTDAIITAAIDSVLSIDGSLRKFLIAQRYYSDYTNVLNSLTPSHQTWNDEWLKFKLLNTYELKYKNLHRLGTIITEEQLPHFLVYLDNLRCLSTNHIELILCSKMKAGINAYFYNNKVMVAGANLGNDIRRNYGEIFIDLTLPNAWISLDDFTKLFKSSADFKDRPQKTIFLNAMKDYLGKAVRFQILEDKEGKIILTIRNFMQALTLHPPDSTDPVAVDVTNAFNELEKYKRGSTDVVVGGIESIFVEDSSKNINCKVLVFLENPSSSNFNKLLDEVSNEEVSRAEIHMAIIDKYLTALNTFNEKVQVIDEPLYTVLDLYTKALRTQLAYKQHLLTVIAIGTTIHARIIRDSLNRIYDQNQLPKLMGTISQVIDKSAEKALLADALFRSYPFYIDKLVAEANYNKIAPYGDANWEQLDPMTVDNFKRLKMYLSLLEQHNQRIITPLPVDNKDAIKAEVVSRYILEEVLNLLITKTYYELDIITKIPDNYTDQQVALESAAQYKELLRLFNTINAKLEANPAAPHELIRKPEYQSILDEAAKLPLYDDVALKQAIGQAVLNDGGKTPDQIKNEVINLILQRMNALPDHRALLHHKVFRDHIRPYVEILNDPAFL